MFGDARFARLSQIPVSHLYNLRRDERYRKQRVLCQRTRASTSPPAVPIRAAGSAGGALRELYGRAEDFLMRDRRLTQAATVEDTPACRVGFPILPAIWPMAELLKLPWGMIAACIAAIILLITVWTQLIKPWWRRWLIKRPCTVYFVIRPLQVHPLGYAVQDEQRHSVRELVLPANATLEVEIGYNARLPFHLTELVFGCEGDDNKKPYATELFNRFVAVGKSRFIPGEDAGHYLDIHRYYHFRCDVSRNVGTHYVLGFKMTTRSPGRYKTSLSFITDEREGNAHLSVIVEDSPRTRMKCVDHFGCYVRPFRSTTN